MLYFFLADGFEETELIAPVDILRRAGHAVTLVSVTGNLRVSGSHGIGIAADRLFESCDFSDGELFALPGGMPGTTNLGAHKGLCALLTDAFSKRKRIAAICAAPSVLGKLGICKGKTVICYPGFEKSLTGAKEIYKAGRTVTDGTVTTAVGAGGAIDFGLELVRVLDGADKAHRIRQDLCY